MTTEKIIDLREAIEKRLEVSILRQEDIIVLMFKRCMFIIMLNPKIQKKSICQKIINYLKTRKSGIKLSKSIVKITKEECKNILLGQIGKILIKKNSNIENQIWEEMKEKIWQEIEEEIINSKRFCYQYKIGSISDRENSFTYAKSLIFSIIK